MATVRMSKQLVSDLCDEFIKNYDTVNPVPQLDANLGDQLWETFTKPLVDNLKQAVEDTFDAFEVDEVALEHSGAATPGEKIQDYLFTKASTLSIAVKTDPVQRNRDSNVDYQLRDYTETYEPMTPENGYDEEQCQPELTTEEYILSTSKLLIGERYGAARLDLFHFDTHPLAIQAKANVDAQLQHKYVRAGKVNAFFNMLNRFQTLNQAVKAWPQLAGMVDKIAPEKMVTIHKRTERKAKSIEQKDFVEQNSGEFNNIILGSTLLGDD